MSTVVSETDALKVIRFFVGADEGHSYEFVNVETGHKLVVSERDLLDQIARHNITDTNNMAGRKFRVSEVTQAENGYAGKRYGGLIGKSRYDSVEQCEGATGFPVSLEFEDGRSDGFLLSELEEVK